MSRHARRRASRRRGLPGVPGLPGLPVLPLVTLAVTLLGSLLALVVGLLGTGASPPSPGAGPPVVAADGADAALLREATEALRTWDVARARAWARADLTALAALYAPGSAAGEADVAMLRRWRERGLAVAGLRTQVLGVRVLDAAPSPTGGPPDQLVLAVTDRLAGGQAVPVTGPRRGDPALELPTGDQPTERTVTLRRDDGGVWRVLEVRPLA